MKRKALTKVKELPGVLFAGSNRGAQANVPALAAVARDSTGDPLDAMFVDRRGDRALARATEARLLGVRAEGKQGRIPEAVDGTKIPVLQTDDPRSVAETLLKEEAAGIAIFVYLLLKLPDGKLWSLRALLEPGDNEGRMLLVKLLSRIAEILARGGSSLVVGAQADPAHAAAEDTHRHGISEHLKENLPRVRSGAKPNCERFEMSPDGTTTHPLIILESETWRDPTAIAEDIMRNPPMPLMRGQTLLTAELGPSREIRFHQLRRRTDGNMAVNDTAVVDDRTEPSATTNSWEDERRIRERATATDISMAFAAGMLAPLLVTD